VDARRETATDVARDVATILRAVRDEGEAAVAAFTQKLDRHDLAETGWQIEPAACAAAYDALEPELRAALDLAARRIRTYH
ncbi:histidinol dehydrogenase, partial [Clostridium perfringens]